MTILILGLLLFLGVHSTRIFADGWRTATIARIGDGPWKGIYTLISLAGFVLLIWGYGQARQNAPVLWDPPVFLRYVTAILMLPTLVLLVAGSLPGSTIKAKLHHPQVLSVKLWSFAHLLSNGSLADVLLFGSFLAWSVAAFASARKRDRATGKVYPPGSFPRTVACVVIGAGLFVALLMGLHRWLFGVPAI